MGVLEISKGGVSVFLLMFILLFLDLVVIVSDWLVEIILFGGYFFWEYVEVNGKEFYSSFFLILFELV